jgi:hypothetical protein
MSMLNRIVAGFGFVAIGSAAIALPAQAGPNCLPYVTDSGQIVVICRQAENQDSRDQFPRDMTRREPG